MDTRSKIKRDLSRWSRKLLLCIGLEDLGKHLVGESKWHSLYPLWRDLERTADFDPSEVPEPDIPETANSADLSHVDPSDTAEEEVGEEKNETLENFIHSLPYWLSHINRAFGQGLGFGELGAANLDAFSDVNQRLNSIIFLEAIRQQYAQVPPALQNSFNHVQNSPLFSPDVFEGTKIAKSPFMDVAKYNDALQLGLRGLSSADHEDHDEPLDLTQKNVETENVRKPEKFPAKEIRKDDEGSNARSLNTAADTPKTQNKGSSRPNQRAGKGYTTLELEAALKDIQSGKLGTRRAAVIYGIPRSTLRNKVYKLGKDRSRPYFRQKNSAGVNSTEDVDEQPSNASVSTRNHGVYSNMEIDVQPHNFATTTNNNNLGLPHTSLSSQTQRGGILPFRSSHRLQEPGCSGEDEVGKSEDEISHEKKVLKEWLRSKLSRQAFVEQQNCKSRSPCDRFSSSHSTSIGNNRALADEEPLSDSSDNSDVSRQDFRKEVILKIPLRNNKSSLSRVISRKKLKRRTQKDQEDNHSPPYSLPLMTVLGAETCSSSMKSVGESKVESLRGWKNTGPGMSEDGNDSMDDDLESAKSLPLSTGKGEKHSSWTSSLCGRNELQTSTPSSSNMESMVTDANGKKSRPKRGKYRNYDRDALLKAVRAVQNGEMSVHRAGSFYGVPHSTLEYKVKERHLLRRPKRKETESPKHSQKSSPESSMSGSDHQQPRTASTPSGVETNNNNSSNLPLTPDLRESLSRYLNIGQSSENSSLSGIGRSMSKQEESLYSRENRIDNHSLGLGRRGIISPFFNLGDLIRQNLETNSLLDLTKK